MDFTTIFDISSLIWDRADYDANAHNYYRLADSLLDLLGKLEGQTTGYLMRKQLLDRIHIEFPFYELPNDFRDFIDAIYLFLSKMGSEAIEYPDNINNDLISAPNLIKQYYNDETKDELKCLISRIHSDEDSDKIYFSFEYLWDEVDLELVTKDGTETVTHKIIISDRANDLDEFLESLKPKFMPNRKHDPVYGHKTHGGEPVSPLSCYKGKDKSIPQDLLDRGEKSGKRIYNYDDDNKVWVVFSHHEANIYHAWDETDWEKIPFIVKKRLNKLK